MNLPKLENGALSRSKTGLLWLGMALSMIGLAAMTTEFYRTFTDIQPSIRWNYVWLAFLPFAVGALLVYYLNPMKVIDKALEVAQQATPLLGATRFNRYGHERCGVDRGLPGCFLADHPPSECRSDFGPKAEGLRTGCPPVQLPAP